MARWPSKKVKDEEQELSKKEVKLVNGMVPFTTKKELPECETRINKKGIKLFVKYGEPRYFLKQCDGGYKLIKIFKKINCGVKRGVAVYKRKSGKDMAIVKQLRASGIPVIGD
ncbi:MAG: hypothetical protein KAJ48_08015 [Elusimicrobiales bacterium]|nr:hypothetical protein [Elusimicrobiales bacterium]